VLISRAGIERVQEKIADLRRRLENKTSEAADMYKSGGDAWHDNPGLDDLTAQRERTRAQIRSLEEGLMCSVYIDDIPDQGVITAGYTVIVRYDNKPEERTFVILGPAEADPDLGVISCESPLAAALAGHKAGDTITVNSRKVAVVSASRWDGLHNDEA